MTPKTACLRRRDLLALAGAAAATAALPARAEAPAILRGAPATETVTGRAFGTEWRVTLPAGADAGRLGAPIADLLAGIDRRMSPWRADSEVSRFNAAPRGAVPVSPDTAAVARAALAVARASGGAFDPAVGPLVARWGFGPIRGAAGAWTGLSAGEDELVKDDAGLTFDPCGIAKGHALDRMADLVAAQGGDFLIDLGGELRAAGRHPEGRDWRIGIEDPRPGIEGLFARLAPGPRAVATSGRRAQGYDIGGVRIGHIIDPASRRPAAGRLGSVTVLAATGLAADGWATALFAAGPAGPDMARAHGLSALFLVETDAGLAPILTGDIADRLV